MFKVLTLILISLSSLGQDKIQLVTGSGYPPFTTSQIKGGGKAVKLVRDVFSSAGVNIGLTWMPWKRAEERTRAGEFHAIFPYVKNVEREKNFHFSTPLYNIKMFLYTNKDKSNLTLTGFLKQYKKLCLPVGYNIQEIAPLIKEHDLKLTRPVDMKTCFLMLNKKRVHSVYVNNYLATSLIQSESLSKIHAIEHVIAKKKLHMMFPKKLKSSKDLLKKFNKSLQKLTELGK